MAMLIWQSGSPDRGVAQSSAQPRPALIAPHTAGLWIYLVGPLGGSLLAAAVVTALPGIETRTAKLLHDPPYPSTWPPPSRYHRSHLPAITGLYGLIE